jgi:hypothetical protein
VRRGLSGPPKLRNRNTACLRRLRFLRGNRRIEHAGEIAEFPGDAGRIDEHV